MLCCYARFPQATYEWSYLIVLFIVALGSGYVCGETLHFKVSFLTVDIKYF